MCSERVRKGHLLCKVSHFQLTQVQRKTNFDVKINKVNGLKFRSRSVGQGACLKGVSWTITIDARFHSQLSLMQRKSNFDLQMNKVNGA